MLICFGHSSFFFLLLSVFYANEFKKAHKCSDKYFYLTKDLFHRMIRQKVKAKLYLKKIFDVNKLIDEKI